MRAPRCATSRVLCPSPQPISRPQDPATGGSMARNAGVLTRSRNTSHPIRVRCTQASAFASQALCTCLISIHPPVVHVRLATILIYSRTHATSIGLLTSLCEGLGKDPQHGLIDVIKSDFEALFCHPHPSKPMRSHPKSLLRVPGLYWCKICPPSPFDDLLIKSHIEVGLVMLMTSKVHVNVALPDQLFECVPDKPGAATAIASRGTGGIMAEQKAPARLVTQIVLRYLQLV